MVESRMVIPPEERQPQVITSPDGKFQIINHHSYGDRLGCYCIEGVIKYVSPEPNLNAKIKVDYYNIDREIVDTEVVTLDCLGPGITRSFLIMYSGLPRREIQYPKMYITSERES